MPIVVKVRPQNPARSIGSLSALASGGKVAVIVTPGSAIPKSPAGQKQEILDMFTAGLFNPTIPGAEIALQLMEFAGSSKALSQFNKLKEGMAAEQAAAQQEQARQQMEVARMQAEMQAMGRVLSAPGPAAPPPPGEDPMQAREHQAALDTAKMQAEEQTKAQSQMQTAEHKATLDIAETEARAQIGAKYQVATNAAQGGARPSSGGAPRK